jgi:hypothetical protein
VGVSGPVVFFCLTAYYPGNAPVIHIIITQFSGSSAANTLLTIKPNTGKKTVNITATNMMDLLGSRSN